MSGVIPRIDLADFHNDCPAKKARLIKALGRGLCETGFVIVANHGIPSDTSARCYELFEDLFRLPNDVKAKYVQIPGYERGYTPFGVEQAKDAVVPDLKEFWHVGQSIPEGHELEQYYPENLWPEEMPALKSQARSMYRAFENCANTLLTALALYFDLEEDRFARLMKLGNSVYRVIHYPALDSSTLQGAVRAAAHEDINLITLLLESRGGGLEILTRDGRWIPVNALAGDLIVDSGDMLSRLTNGRVPATTHRVVNPPSTENDNVSRYSMPFFVHPRATCDLSVMTEFTSKENPARWPSITAHEFLTQRLAEIGLMEEAVAL